MNLSVYFINALVTLIVAVPTGFFIGYQVGDSTKDQPADTEQELAMEGQDEEVQEERIALQSAVDDEPVELVGNRPEMQERLSENPDIYEEYVALSDELHALFNELTEIQDTGGNVSLEQVQQYEDTQERFDELLQYINANY